MSLGPKFSATTFQKVMQRALGGRSDVVKNALTHIGQGDVIRTGAGASVADAREMIDMLAAKGEIENVGDARRAFRKAERVATAIDRVHQQDIRADRLKEFDRTRDTFKDSVVRQQAHGVAIQNDKNTSGHSVSISQIKKHLRRWEV